MILKQY